MVPGTDTGTDSMVPGALKPLLDMGCGRNSVNSLTNHQQKATFFVVSSMLALRWIEERVTKNRESSAPTVESLNVIDYSRKLELFETTCKVFAVPMDMWHLWSRISFFS